MRDPDAYQQARNRAEAKYGFYRHLTVYGAVMVLLLVINLITSSGYYWFIWPLLGWGVAVAIHAVTTFFISGDSMMIERMTERELEKQSREQ